MGSELHDNLASLLAHGPDGYAPLGDWFTYHSYTGQRGVVVASESDGALDIFATRLPYHRRAARLLLGNHGGVTGPVAVVIDGLRATGLENPHVLVERIPYGDGRPIKGPVVVRDPQVDLNVPATATIVLDYADTSDAFAITLDSRELRRDRA